VTVAMTLKAVVALEESVVPWRGPRRGAQYEWCGFARQQCCSRLQKESQIGHPPQRDRFPAPPEGSVSFNHIMNPGPRIW